MSNNSVETADSLPPWRSPSKTAGDYLLATLFLAALFHGVLIMGVTFTAEDALSDGDEATSLEVVIITSEYQTQRASEDAQLLAESSLLGSGNTIEDVPVSIAYDEMGNSLMAGMPQDGKDQRIKTQQPTYAEQILLVSKQPESARLEREFIRQQEIEQMHQGLSGDSKPTEIIAAPSEKTLIKSSNARELIISANTRESVIATYLEGWKRKIERVGTMNFPETSQARRNPILEVAVATEGTLQEVIIVRSSGNKKLDQAAINILRMAAPFDPFPSLLKKNFDVLRFSYEWHFTGEMTSAKLRVSEQQ